MKKIMVSSIDWYRDDDEIERDKRLPTDVEIIDPNPSLMEDIHGEAENLAEYLTAEYECLVNGFVVEVGEV